jgi:hypothetical protein
LQQTHNEKLFFDRECSGSRLRDIPPRQLGAVIVARFEDGSGQRSAHVQNVGLGDIPETMLGARRYENRVSAADDDTIISHPDLGAAFDNGQNLLDGVEMRRRAKTRLAKLFENAQLSRSVDRRDEHACGHALSPILDPLRFMFNEFHFCSLSLKPRDI